MSPGIITSPPNMTGGAQGLQGGILTNSRQARLMRLVALLFPLALFVLVSSNFVGRYSYLPAINFTTNFSTNASQLQGIPPQWHTAVSVVTAVTEVTEDIAVPTYYYFTTNFSNNFSTNAEELQGMPPKWQMAVTAVTDLTTNFNTNFSTNHEAKREAAEAQKQKAEEAAAKLIMEEEEATAALKRQ